MISSFYNYAREYPPILVRLLARKKSGPPLTTAEISWFSAGALSEYEVNTISALTDWDSVPFGKMRAFLVACGTSFTDPASMNRKRVYLKQEHKFLYLRKSHEFETILKPLVLKYRQHIAKEIKR